MRKGQMNAYEQLFFSNSQKTSKPVVGQEKSSQMVDFRGMYGEQSAYIDDSA